MKLLKEIWGNLPFQVRVVGVAGVGVLLILLIVLGRIGACRQRLEDQKIERLGTNAKTAEIEANMLTNQKVEVEKDVNKANANLDNVLGTDSGNRESGFGTVKRKFCADHPNDSKCRK